MDFSHTFLGIAIAFALQDTFKNRMLWWWYIFAACLVNIILFCAFYAWGKSKYEKDLSPVTQAATTQAERQFSARIRTLFYPSSPGAFTPYWVITGARLNQRHGNPVAMLMFVQIANLRDTAMMIDSYSVEADDGAGNWVLLPPIECDPRFEKLLLVDDPFAATQHDLVGGTFQSAARNHDIGPGSTLQGWILFGKADRPISNSLRMRITDTVGRQFVEPMELAFDRAASQVQAAEFRVGEKDIDVSDVLGVTPFGQETPDQWETAAQFWPVAPLYRHVTKLLTEFAGQRFSIEYPVGDWGGRRLAFVIKVALMRAKWEDSKGQINQAQYPINFKNVMVGINPKDRNTEVMRAASYFTTGIFNLGLLPMEPFQKRTLLTLSDVPEGEIMIRIASNPEAIKERGQP